jgi:hypothetical protein
LANRLLALVSGFQVATSQEAKLFMHWDTRHKACGCPFEHLFLNKIPRVTLKEIRTANTFHNLISRPRPVTNEIRHPWGLGDGSAGVAVCTLWWIKNHPPRPEEYFGQLEPVPRVRNRVNQVWRGLGVKGRVVGFHIRGTDHRTAKERSTPDKFIKIADDLIRQDPSIQFLVCADHEAPRQLLRKRYGDRILLSKPRSYNRRTPAAVEDALVDLLLLGRTERIFGSYNSTFSVAAARWGGIPLTIVQ